MDELPSVRASDTRSINGPQWMTYAEAAQRFGISSEAVRQIALRRKWPRRRPNDDPFGRVQVLVPADEEVRPRMGVQHSDEHPAERASDTRPTAELNTLLERANERVDKAEARAERADADRHAAETRADASMERADRAEKRVDQAEIRADRAEQGRDGERARADALRDRLDTMQAMLADERAGREINEQARQRAEEELRAAQAALQAAQTDLTEAVARPSRGVLAWLRRRRPGRSGG